MNGFLACDVLNFFRIISKLLEAEMKLKLIYIIHLTAFLLSWIMLCYVKIYVYIFLSHNLMHMM